MVRSNHIAMKCFNCVIALAALGVSAALGQTLDSSGNGLLKGAYHFRMLEGANFDQNVGDVTEAVGVSGTITFSGTGSYTITGSAVVDSASVQQTVSASGSYVIGANGFGYIVNPLATSDATQYIYGAVGQGVFVGSSTEGPNSNTFIAIPAGTAPTNATFTASYWAGLIDFPSGSSTNLKNALFELSPNGQGTFGSISLNGQAQNQGAANGSTVSQTVSGAKYTFPGDGSISLNIPLPSGVTSTNALITGARTMFVSADGNFVLGYTVGGYDLIFGVKALASSASNSIFSGLYYTSALEDFPGNSGNGCGDVDSYYGSLVSTGNGSQIIHERLWSTFCNTIDYEEDDQTNFIANGNATDITFYQLAFGDGGQAFVGIGSGGEFSLLAGVHANTFTGPGVFLNPVGVANAASYAPITASVAPGELVTLVGTGLANNTQVTQGGLPFPPMLGGVQVLVNNTPAPIYYISSTQISAILPYEISNSSLASIQVSNNGTKSGTVTLFTSDAMPGVFSTTSNGLGFAIANHAATGQPVTPTNPAVAGEYLAVVLTGLGTVTPSITDGAVGPSSPPSLADVNTQGNLDVFFDDFNAGNFPQATVAYAGLAPTLAGLYQMNVQVPTGVGPGDVYLELLTDMADVLQIQIPVGGSSGSAVTAQDRTGPRRPRGRAMAPRMRSPKKSSRTNAIERSQEGPR